MKVKAHSDSPENHQVSKQRRSVSVQAGELAEKSSINRALDVFDPAVPLRPIKYLNQATIEGLVFVRTQTFVDNSVKNNNKVMHPLDLKALFDKALTWTPENRRLAGRALQKHGDRLGSFWPRSKGTVADKENQAVSLVEKIISSRHTLWVYAKKTRTGGIALDLVSMSGRGVRYRPQGLFTFIEVPENHRNGLLEALKPRRQT
jgi:hypothetical protein